MNSVFIYYDSESIILILWIFILIIQLNQNTRVCKEFEF